LVPVCSKPHGFPEAHRLTCPAPQLTLSFHETTSISSCGNAESLRRRGMRMRVSGLCARRTATKATRFPLGFTAPSCEDAKTPAWPCHSSSACKRPRRQHCACTVATYPAETRTKSSSDICLQYFVALSLAPLQHGRWPGGDGASTVRELRPGTATAIDSSLRRSGAAGRALRATRPAVQLSDTVQWRKRRMAEASAKRHQPIPPTAPLRVAAFLCTAIAHASPPPAHLHTPLALLLPLLTAPRTQSPESWRNH